MYAREVDGETLTFAVSGLLWERSLVMIDEESDSLWSHLLGRCMRGEFEGHQLKRLPGEMTNWKKWLELHPKTTAAIMKRSSRTYRRDFYKAPDRYLIGCERGKLVRAWPFPDLVKHPVVNDRLGKETLLIVFDAENFTAAIYDRTVDGRELTFEQNGKTLIDRETARRWDPLTGKSLGEDHPTVQLKRLPGVVSYTKAWRRFFPKSTYWRAPNRATPKESD